MLNKVQEMNVSWGHIQCQERSKKYIQHETLGCTKVLRYTILEILELQSPLKGADNSKVIKTLKNKKEWEDAPGPASLLVWVKVS